MNKKNNKLPVKVIHLTPLGSGGISKLTVSINKLLNADNVTFDYLVFRNHKEFLEDEALSFGGKKQVIDTENIHNTLIKVLWKEIQMVKLFKKEKYDVVHVDASTPYDVVVALAAKIAGIKRIVMHSHNDNFQKSIPLRDAFMKVYKLLMLPVVTDYLAISVSAAEFMFPKKILLNHEYKLVHNGINVDDYDYSDEDRIKYRKELGLEDKFVIGHIGRFVYQKNHEFIIEIFEQFHFKHPESVLLLVGEGELKEHIQKRVVEKGLKDNVIFYGTTHDVRKVLHVMDAFVFPSHFEGLGIVAIESQATGLATYCADTIVEEVNITDCFIKISGWDPNVWAKIIWENSQNTTARCSRKKMIVNAGYDIKAVAKYLEAFYLDIK